MRYKADKETTEHEFLEAFKAPHIPKRTVPEVHAPKPRGVRLKVYGKK